MENWKPVPGYEALYEVSDLGNVVSKRSMPPEPIHGDLSHGYPRVVLTNRGKRIRILVHNLVLLTFIGPPPKGHEANHKNGIKHDARLKNLEYVTRKYNQWHCNHVIKTREPQKGSKHGMHKLTEKEVIEIRSLQGSMPMKQVAKKFGVNIPSISLIWNRKTWRHI